MSMFEGRGPSVLVLLLVAAGGALLAILPGDPGAIRLGGVSLSWWYAGAVAPLVAAAAALPVLMPDRSETMPVGAGTVMRAIAAWTGPALFALVAARVFAGAADAPIVLVTALVAPLVAARLPLPGEPGRLGAIATVAALALILWADLLVAAEVATAGSLPRGPVIVGLAVLAFVTSLPAIERWWAPILAGALAGLVLVVATLGASVGRSPWAAWSEVASRPALAFAETSPAVSEGRRVATPTSLLFAEPHRVTALSPGLYRVVESAEGRDGRPPTVRDWRLGPGETLTLRPGDRMTLPAGARVRFEPGKRVPGAPPSGVAWADPPDRRSPRALAESLGLVLTLLGGAVALVGPRSLPAVRATAGAWLLLVLFGVVAAAWGVYGVHAAPELALGVPGTTAVISMVAAADPRFSRALGVAAMVALVALFVATVAVLRGRIAALIDPKARTTVWVGLLAAAAAASLWPADAALLFLTGCGLATSAAVVPALTGNRRRSRALGAAVGAGVFVGLALAADHLPDGAAVVGLYPALLAAPLAALLCYRPGGRR
jgi:hypothetical protein